MADERTCYAGDLGSDVLGKRVRYTLKTVPPTIREMTVTEVKHSMRLLAKPLTRITGVVGGDYYDNRNDVTIQQLDHDAIVEVLP